MERKQNLSTLDTKKKTLEDLRRSCIYEEDGN